MVLSVGEGCLHGFGDVKDHPIITATVNEVRVLAHVGADGSTAALRPVVDAVVRCCIGRCGPVLENRANGDWFVFNRAVLGKHVQLGFRHTSARWLGNFA